MSHDYENTTDIHTYRKQVEEMANQLCLAVDGDFNFRVSVSVPDETLDKLALLMNFVIESARRSLSDLKKQNSALENIKRDLEVLVDERTKELLLQTQKAVAANKAKDQFLANMSHEMRTPLTAIVGFSELMADESISPESDNYLATIHRNSHHLLNLIDEILDFSKIEMGKLVIELKEFCLRELLNNVVQSFKPQIEKKSIRLNIKVDSDASSKIICDITRVRQILVNLISNAIKFTEQGTVQITLDTSRDKVFVIEVVDTGIGISSEAQLKLFKPFTQADMSTSRKYGGTGLGLALSRKIAKALGGELLLTSSEPGKGSCFILTLPKEGGFHYSLA